MLASLLAILLVSAPASSIGHTLQGVVRHSKTGKPVARALVVIQCTCLEGHRETSTNERGLYSFRDLPSGTYTVEVLVGSADVVKIVELGRR